MAHRLASRMIQRWALERRSGEKRGGGGAMITTPGKIDTHARENSHHHDNRHDGGCCRLNARKVLPGSSDCVLIFYRMFPRSLGTLGRPNSPH